MQECSEMLHRSESAELKQLPGCEIWVPIANKTLSILWQSCQHHPQDCGNKLCLKTARIWVVWQESSTYLTAALPSVVDTVAAGGLPLAMVCFPATHKTDQMQVLFWICKGNETCKSWRTKKITYCFFFLVDQGKL
jgi:hypothetical protein